MKVGDFVMVEFHKDDICFAKIIDLISSDKIMIKLIGDREGMTRSYSLSEYTVGLSIVTILTDEEAMLKKLEYAK